MDTDSGAIPEYAAQWAAYETLHRHEPSYEGLLARMDYCSMMDFRGYLQVRDLYPLLAYMYTAYC